METVFHNGHVYTLKMGLLQTFLIGLIICLSIHSTTCCPWFELQYGNVSDDQDLEVGSRLTFQCTLSHETVQTYGVTSKDLTLKKEKTLLLGTRIVDNYTVEYEVEESSPDNSGIYQCFVPIPDFDQPQLVCASDINVGTKPQNVSDFKCIGDSFRNLSCSWVAPHNDIRTTYKLKDFINNDPSLVRTCPLPNVKQSSCQFGLDTKPPYLRNQATLNFILVGENSLGTNSQYFSIKHYEIVKPGQPNKVSIKDVSKNSMVIEILAPKGLEYGEFPNGLIYDIKYYSISTKLNVVKEESVQNKTNAQLEIKNLVPHTQYKFEVRCRLNITGDHYASDEYTVNDITRPDVPYLAPEVDASGFDLQPVDNNAVITLYWKAVPSEFENGEKFHYVIKYHEYYLPPRYKRGAKRDIGSSVEVGNCTTHTLNLDKDSAYIFTILAKNDVGLSFNQSAVIVVDKANKLLSELKDITVVRYNQTHYDLSWKSGDPQLTTFTVATCETLKSRPSKCEGPISFIEVSNRTHYKFSNLNAKTNYQFAVAVTDRGRTSGLYWANCIVEYGVVYGVKTIHLTPKTSTSLELTWYYLCSAVTQVIREIEIAVCPSQETCSPRNYERCSVNDLGVSGWPTHRITNSSATKFVISNLHPFTQYYAVLRIRTDAGWGPYSNYYCESTMPSAPSDPPTNVYAEVQPVQDYMKTSVRVSFDPPNMPNGIVSSYIVYYNVSNDDGKDRKVPVRNGKGTSVTLERISYHTNYSIQVSACVGLTCSALSKPIYLYTGISNPGIINLPRVEQQDKGINISWDLPAMPNGPLNYYQVVIYSNKSNVEQVHNVSGRNFLALDWDCESEEADHSTSEFRVRAVNINEGVHLYGEYSRPLTTKICSDVPSTLIIALISLGVLLGIFFVTLFGYFFVKCIRNHILAAKNAKIKLPHGLESPLDSPLNTYDKFKNGLQSHHDSGIPYERGYERFFSHADQNGIKNTDSLSMRGTTGRNLSGESDISVKCPDSLSSANTTKTHNSIDSGNEIESPPSPDSLCSDSGSTNTTPRTFKPGLDIVNETSKDSGLEKGSSHIAPNPNFTGKNMWCVKRPNDAQLNGYSMFAYRGSSNTPPYVLRGEQQNLVECLSLSNSEPSVADFDVGDGTEPLVNPVIQPYSKFGLARSASNGINLPQPLSGYCKFGIVYRPLKNSQQFAPHDQQVFPAATSGFPEIGSSTFKKKEDALPSGKTALPEYAPNAYSKFGVVEVGSMNCAIDNNLDALLVPGFENLNDNRFGFPEDEAEPKQASPDNLYSSLPTEVKGWEDKHLGLPAASESPSSENADYPELSPSESADFLQNLLNGLSPSHEAHPSRQSPEDAPDATRVQFKDGFPNGALEGFEAAPTCFENDAVPDLELPEAEDKKAAFKKTFSNVDELLRCLDNGCLPDLVMPASKSDDDDDGTFIMGGNASGIDGTESNSEHNSDQTGENGIEDGVPAVPDSANSLENESQPVPNVYVEIPSIRYPENLAQVNFQSNPPLKLV